MPPFQFQGRTALVTGAASGLGRACALALRAAGATVIALDRDATGLASLAGDGLATVTVDVTDRAGVDAAVAACPCLDVLVTAAGVLQRPAAPESLSDKEWARVLDTNLAGTFHVAAAAGARMATGGGGAIVMVASVTGLQAGPVHAYSAAKAGVISLTSSLAARWGRDGVRVNAVAPGYVRTPALDKALHFGVLDDDRLDATTALGRLVTADEVAAAVLFLASDVASGITGAVLPVDAGTLTLAGWAPFGGPGGA